MRRLFPLCHALQVSLVIAAAAANCMGQNPSIDLADASLEQLGNIEVYTASKHLQSGADAPSSVTVITADDIAKHGYRTLADILQNVRGFFVTYDRNYSSLGVRGFARPGDYNTRILLLVDGHRLNDNLYDEAMLGTEFPVDVDLIERIEIVRGPASSLYGSNALFAVINIFTKRGRDVSGLELSSEAASFNTYSGRMTYGKKFQSLEFLLSGSFYGSRGQDHLFFPAFDSPATNYGIASHLDDDQLGSALSTVSFRDFTFQAAYGTRDKGIPTAAYGTLFNTPGTRTTDSHGYVDLSYTHTFADSWDVLARVFYDRYNYEGTYIYSSADNPAEITPNFDYGEGKWWGTEIQVTRTVLQRNRITVGGEYRDNILQQQSNYNSHPYELFLNDNRTSYVTGVYLQDELTITKKLSLNAGLRYDYYNRVDASTNPRAALVYRPLSQSAFKILYGSAFRIPNVYELYYSSPPNLPNPTLKPEKIHTAEFVWEQGIGSHVWLSTSAFHTWMDGLITQIPTANDLEIFENIQDVRSSGVELEIRGQLPGGLEGTASYSFQETKDRATNQFLSDSPRNLAKLSLSQPLLRRKVFFTLDAQYRSRIQSLDSTPISPFTVLNATILGHSIGNHLELSASAYNLLNRTYFDPPSSENLQLPIQQDGRSLRLKLVWNLGGR